MDYLSLASRAALKAGRIHRKYFSSKLKIKKKSSSFDLLTVADTQSEKAIVSLIKRYFPGHNFLCEEYLYKKTNSEYTWIIDPLDGTNNFACGMPIFCSSVAVACKGAVIAGAIYDPMRDELFYARKAGGAFLNGRRISVNSARTLKESLLITGFYYDRDKKMIEALETVKRFLFKRILGVRRLGAAALDLCYVASGRASGFWEFELSPWDFAAGSLIIEEAGGRVTGRQGEALAPYRKSFVIASNSRIHSQMLEVINEAHEELSSVFLDK